MKEPPIEKCSLSYQKLITVQINNQEAQNFHPKKGAIQHSKFNLRRGLQVVKTNQFQKSKC